MPNSEWDAEYKLALSHGQTDIVARITANRMCIMMGKSSSIPSRAADLDRPPLPRTLCVMCAMPYPAHLTGACGEHDMVWPEGDHK